LKGLAWSTPSLSSDSWKTQSSPYINRFVQPDTVIPDLSNPQTWNRFSYTINNPVLHNDPDGHCGTLCVTVIFVVGVLILAGDAPIPPAPAPETATVQQIKNTSPTSGAALVNLFTTTMLSGNTPEARFKTVLDASESGYHQNFAAGFDDSGFKSQFVDPYRGSSNQVAHFLTAANLSYSAGDSKANQYVALSLITGHEMEGDQGFLFVQHVVQGLNGLFRPQAHDAFLHGMDDDFNYILGLGSKNKSYRYGNSIEDLRVSRLGWEFGRKMFNKEFGSLDDVGDWLGDNLVK